MARIYIGSKPGNAYRIRKQVDARVPRSSGEVTFCKDGLIVETVYTTNMREIVYVRVCGWRPVHVHANMGYADQVEIQTGITDATQQQPQNEVYCPY